MGVLGRQKPRKNENSYFAGLYRLASGPNQPLHQHLAVFSRFDVFLTYSLTVSLVSERRPGPTSKVDDRGSRASLLPLAG